MRTLFFEGTRLLTSAATNSQQPALHPRLVARASSPAGCRGVLPHENLQGGETPALPAGEDARSTRAPLSVLEPACGSANDYRFLDAYGLARWLDYTGFDLCAKNIDNARALFPQIRFEVGNVFELAAPDKAFDLCVVHDLFEHLSLEGLEIAIAEVCRVTRRGICVGFFQMDEIRDHIVRPVENYYCNLLSMARTRELFARHGFVAQVIHIDTFLRELVSDAKTHNPNAYTFFFTRVSRGQWSGGLGS